MERKNRKWSSAEDEILLRYVKASPFNLAKCFHMVSEHLTEIGYPRTNTGVQAHWYSVLSKRPEALCFFTASSKHVSKNRKNGKGVESSERIWNKLLRIINKFLP